MGNMAVLALSFHHVWTSAGPLGHPGSDDTTPPSSQLAWSPLTGIENPHGNGAFLVQSASLPGWVSSGYTAVGYSLTECPPTCARAGSLQTHYLGKNFQGVLSSSKKKGNTFSINVSLTWRLDKIAETRWSPTLHSSHTKNVTYKCLQRSERERSWSLLWEKIKSRWQFCKLLRY